MLYRVYVIRGKSKWCCTADIEGRFIREISSNGVFETDDINIAYRYKLACEEMWDYAIFEVHEEKDWP